MAYRFLPTWACRRWATPAWKYLNAKEKTTVSDDFCYMRSSSSKKSGAWKGKVFQILKFPDDILELKQVCHCFVIQYHIVVTCLHGMHRDLHCNPMKVVVSRKVLFVPGRRKWDSLRDRVSRGWRGISHSLPFRADVILSSPSLGCLSLAAKESMCSPPRYRPLDWRKVCSRPFLNKRARI